MPGLANSLPLGTFGHFESRLALSQINRVIPNRALACSTGLAKRKRWGCVRTPSVCASVSKTLSRKNTTQDILGACCHGACCHIIIDDALFGKAHCEDVSAYAQLEL